MFFDELEKFSGKYAIIDDRGDKVSYSDLVDLSDRICEKAVSRQVVFILCQNETEVLCGYLGFLRKRIIPVMVDSNIEEKLLDSLLEKYMPSYIFALERRKIILKQRSVCGREKNFVYLGAERKNSL